MTPTSPDSIGIYELKTHLSAILERVEAGETVTVTRHSHPIAYLSPARPGERSGQEVAESIRARRGGRSLSGLTIRELIDEGRSR